MADSSKTEKATPRRREQAFERGGLPRSRELSGTVALLTVVAVLSWILHGWPGQWRNLFNGSLVAGSGELGPDTPLFRMAGLTLLRSVAPVLGAAWVAACATMLAQGGIKMAPAALTPKATRLNPASHLKQLYSVQGLGRIGKSLVPAAFIAYLGATILWRERAVLGHLTDAAPGQFAPWLFQRIYEISWKSCAVLLVWAILDFVLQRRTFETNLRMSKQEVKDENKQSEGNPAIKRRIRQLQRQMRRRRTLKAVREATVVITNPTHYAVALRYEMESMPAPVVVAKGCDRLALEIRSIATWEGIPIVENRPLAQLLYRSVEEGAVIPAKLYVAVAEILAFVFQMQSRTGAGRRR
jgi:flagellar biosynthetic protein FlhB